jgi:hypothetical protein
MSGGGRLSRSSTPSILSETSGIARHQEAVDVSPFSSPAAESDAAAPTGQKSLALLTPISASHPQNQSQSHSTVCFGLIQDPARRLIVAEMKINDNTI